MIISASRRTDIPAFYGTWFMNRLKEKYVLVRNPMNQSMVSSISLDQGKIDCIVFWTKNPKPFLKHLKTIDDMGFKYYFQFTLTPYDISIEKKLGSKSDAIRTFKKLSSMIGREKVIWRYDPIIFSDKFNIEYHLKWFENLAKELSDSTEKCVVSFLEEYKKIKSNISNLNIYKSSPEVQSMLLNRFQKIAEQEGLALSTCAQDIESLNRNITYNSCIDKELIERITNKKLSIKKDKNQRKNCRCVESRDIGTYNSCSHSCIYCYANYNNEKVSMKKKLYDPQSPILCDSLSSYEKITEVKVRSNKIRKLQKELPFIKS